MPVTVLLRLRTVEAPGVQKNIPVPGAAIWPPLRVLVPLVARIPPEVGVSAKESGNWPATL